ncbi:MAG TPA: hypothetical protein VK206_13920 [Anaerolineales bacterium]|nr:hypothetical protein [Anaerolineales bacterium]
MMIPGFGVGELIVSFIAVAFSLALPIAILFLLYKIYVKLKSIEEHLKKS